MRVHVVLALVAALVLVAVPLYLWRRPRGAASIAPAASAAAVAESADGGVTGEGGATMAAAPVDAAASSRVSLGEVHMVKCVGDRRAKVPVERCEHLPFFEEALAKAIRDNAACAPETANGGTVSFVWTVDFHRKKTHLWAGKSGTIKRRDSRELVRCVSRALPAPDWTAIAHQFQRYDVGVIATYPPSGAASAFGSPPR